MTYLFWSFAVVWIALFAYLRVLMRRTRTLEEEVRRLGADARPDEPRTAERLEDPPAVRHDAPAPVSRALRS